MRAPRQPTAESFDDFPSFIEDNLFEDEGWEGKAGVADWEPFRRLGRSMTDYIANYYEQIEKRPVGARVEPGYLEVRRYPSIMFMLCLLYPVRWRGDIASFNTFAARSIIPVP